MHVPCGTGARLPTPCNWRGLVQSGGEAQLPLRGRRAAANGACASTPHMHRALAAIESRHQRMTVTVVIAGNGTCTVRACVRAFEEQSKSRGPSGPQLQRPGLGVCGGGTPVRGRGQRAHSRRCRLHACVPTGRCDVAPVPGAGLRSKNPGPYACPPVRLVVAVGVVTCILPVGGTRAPHPPRVSTGGGPRSCGRLSRGVGSFRGLTLRRDGLHLVGVF